MEANRLIANRLTIAYMVALLLIATLAGGLHLLLDQILTQQQDSATVINVAGRQRMLSQRIALLASQLSPSDQSTLQPMLDAAALMERSENAIIQGTDLGISHVLSPAAHALYFDGADALDPMVRHYLEAVRRLDGAADAPDRAALFGEIYRLANGPLLPTLNQAVSIFAAEADHRMARLRQAQLVVLVILLLTLGLEAMFIFRPLVVRVRRYTARLYEFATQDSLTGLYNRRFFLDAAEQAVALARRHDQPLALMMLDLDHFKKINDTYGHAAGDATLKAFAEITRSNTRRTDIVGRWGGEEFMILLPATGLRDALGLAEKLRAATEASRQGEVPAFTVSIGLTILDRGDASLRGLLDRSDQAVYDAKSRGRNQVAVRLGETAAQPAGPIPFPTAGAVPLP
jgi:diguanylate cyclase (GGDEF)-like protein